MVAGRLAEKNGYFYIVLSYNGPDGKRVQKWQGTGLPVKGNKKKADELLRQARRAFTPPVPNRSDDLSPDMLFSDYMLYWLEIIRSSVQPTTWSSYCFNVKDHIVPYFEPTGITLGGLQARHIQSFYLHERKTLKSTSVLRLHANLHKALKQAVKLDLIPGNPVDKVERPKPERYMAAYYTAEEMEQLFEAARGHRLELIIQFAAFYGLRRGEVLGLRWDAIDFAAGTFTIRHTVTTASVEGKHLLTLLDARRDLLQSFPVGGFVSHEVHSPFYGRKFSGVFCDPLVLFLGAAVEKDVQQISHVVFFLNGLQKARVRVLVRRLGGIVGLPFSEQVIVVRQDAPAVFSFFFPHLRLRFLPDIASPERGLAVIGKAKILGQLLGGLLGGQVIETGGEVGHVAGGPAAKAVEVVLVQLQAGVPVIVEGAAGHAAAPHRDAVHFSRFPDGDGLLHDFKYALAHTHFPPALGTGGLYPAALARSLAALRRSALYGSRTDTQRLGTVKV